MQRDATLVPSFTAVIVIIFIIVVSNGVIHEVTGGPICDDRD